MRIRLLQDLPIQDAVEQGCVSGAEFEVKYIERCRNARVFFTGLLGDDCACYRRECEIIEEDDPPS